MNSGGCVWYMHVKYIKPSSFIDSLVLLRIDEGQDRWIIGGNVYKVELN